jgi:hypothetical protein
LSRAFEQTLTVDTLRDKIDDAESALRPGRRSTSDSTEWDVRPFSL